MALWWWRGGVVARVVAAKSGAGGGAGGGSGRGGDGVYRQRRRVGLGRAGGVDLGWVEVGPNGALVVAGWGVVARALGMPVHTDTHISKHTPRKRRARGTAMDERVGLHLF